MITIPISVFPALHLGDSFTGDGSVAAPLIFSGTLTIADIQRLRFTDENRVVLPAGLTTSWDPGSSCVIAAAADPPYAMVDSLAPVALNDDNRMRILKNVGNAPIVLLQGWRSSGPGQQHFQLTSIACIPNSSNPPSYILMTSSSSCKAT